MKYNFIFDVDGTLTPSRQKIDNNFFHYFLDFCRNNIVYLVTGSDRDKTIEQLGLEIYNSCNRVYNCLGNDIWEANNNIYCNNWTLPPTILEALNFLLASSEFPLRTGNHIEERTGTVNFSIIGRNATLEQRAEYVDWDRRTNERIKIANALNDLFPEIQVSIGGETGVDIIQRGKDKSQIISHFQDADSKLVFFGDRMDQGGNDYSLSRLILEKNGELHHVKGYKDTWEVLRNVY